MHQKKPLLKSDLMVASRLFNKDFLLEEQAPLIEDYQELWNRVEFVIRDLLDHDMAGLLQILYRIDVNEKRVKEILSFSNPENISELLTELVLNREFAKVETRKQYKS